MASYIESLERTDALEWLVTHYDCFPTEIKGGITKEIGPTLYKQWRFIKLLDGELVFSDIGMNDCIREYDFEHYRKEVMYI